VTAHITKS